MNYKLVARRLRAMAEELEWGAVSDSTLKDMDEYMQKNPKEFCSWAEKQNLGAPYSIHWLPSNSVAQNYEAKCKENARRGDLISCQIVKDLNQPKIIFITNGDSGNIFIEISHLTDSKLQQAALKGEVVDEWPNQPPADHDSGYYQHPETGHFYMEDTDEDVENRFPTVMEELKKRWEENKPEENSSDQDEEDTNYPLLNQALAQLSGWKPASNFSPFQRNGNALDSYDLNISTKKPTPSGDLGMYPCIEIDARRVAFVNSEWDLATEIDMTSLSSVEELKSAIKSEIPHLYSTVKDLWW